MIVYSDKIFYAHLVEINEIHEYLNELDLQKKECDELINLIYSTLHHEILNLILSNLPRKHHRLFLMHLQKRPHDQSLMIFVKRSISGIEDQIRRITAIVKHEIIDDIETYKLAVRESMEE